MWLVRIAGNGSIPFSFATGIAPPQGIKARRFITNLLVSGLMGIFFPAFLFAWAQTQLNSSLAGILNTLSPLWTMIIGALFFTQRFRGFAILGIVISFTGTILLALSREGGTVTGFNVYALIIVVACALYGANLNWVKFKIHDLGFAGYNQYFTFVYWPTGSDLSVRLHGFCNDSYYNTRCLESFWFYCIAGAHEYRACQSYVCKTFENLYTPLCEFSNLHYADCSGYVGRY
jgi:drug/metabolite transporter (DMT)-like permease